MGLFSKINKMVAEEKQAKQALKEIEKRSIATSLAFDKIMEPINEYNKKGDQQLERLKKETQFSKETGDVQKLIEVYEDVLLNEGLCFNGKGYYINLAELYYKTGQLDKAWGYLNKIGVEHPELISKIRDFQSKVLRKEKKYQDALLFQIISLYYDFSDDWKPAESKIDKNLNGLIKKCKMEDKTDSFRSLIFDSKDEVDLRNKFKEILIQIN